MTSPTFVSRLSVNSKFAIAALAFAWSVDACCAQSVVVPAEASVGPGKDIGQPLFFGSASFGWPGLRVQSLYDTVQIPTGPRTIRSISVRRETGPLSNHATTVNATIRMSTTSTQHSAAGTSFVANHGPNLTTVFQGTITMPPSGARTQWPAPWETPIVFQTPFSFVNAPGSLVIDVATTGSGDAGSWSVEVYEIDEGESTRDLVQTDCRSSTGQTVLGRVEQNHLVPGGHFRVGFNFYPSNQPLLHTSFIGVGFAGTSAPGLPYLLNMPGLPAAEGCQWGVDVEVALDATYFPGPQTHPALGMVGMSSTMPIPNNPLLVDFEFFAQALSLDAGPDGTPQLLASGSTRMRIGSGLAPSGSIVTALDHLATTGSVQPGKALAMRFD